MFQRNRRYQAGSVFLYKGKKKKTWYGMWRRDVIDGDGKLRRKQQTIRLGSIRELPTKRDAWDALRALMAPAKPETEMTFSQLVQQFEKLQVPMLKPSTGRYRLRMLKSPALNSFASAQITSVTKLDVEALVIAESKRVSRSVVRGLLSSLSQMMQWAVDHGWLQKNPSQGVRIPHACAGKRVKRYVCTATEANAIISRLHEPYATLVLLLATTGLRIGEAIALRHEDFEGDFLHVRRRIFEGEVDTVKTRASDRLLPIPESLRKRLQGLSREGWIFQATNGAPLNPKNMINRYVKPAVKAAGLEGINWHSFRHSFQVAQRRAGTHPKLISDLLGHASVSTAMDVYDHASEAELRQPLDQLLQSVMKSEVVQ